MFRCFENTKSIKPLDPIHLRAFYFVVFNSCALRFELGVLSNSMSNPNDPDPWPRYAVLSQALKLSPTAALKYGVHGRPTYTWTVEQILLVALETLRENK